MVLVTVKSQFKLYYVAVLLFFFNFINIFFINCRVDAITIKAEEQCNK